MNDAKNIIHRPAAFNGVHPAKITKSRMVEIIDELEYIIDLERKIRIKLRGRIEGINRAKVNLDIARTIANAAIESWESHIDTVSDREWSLIRIIESLYSSMCAAERELDGEG